MLPRGRRTSAYTDELRGGVVEHQLPSTRFAQEEEEEEGEGEGEGEC